MASTRLAGSPQLPVKLIKENQVITKTYEQKRFINHKVIAGDTFEKLADHFDSNVVFMRKIYREHYEWANQPKVGNIIVIPLPDVNLNK